MKWKQDKTKVHWMGRMMKGEVEISKIGKNWWDLKGNWKGKGKLARKARKRI